MKYTENNVVNIPTPSVIEKPFIGPDPMKNNIIAFDSGYTKSRTAIIDANITTLLAAIILFFMGSGPIKGFSITLGVGIFTTLFSVYFLSLIHI